MKQFDLSIGQRLAFGFGTVLFLLLLLVSFSLYESRRIEALQRQLTQRIGPRADAAVAMQQAYLRQAVAARNYALSGGGPELLAYREAVGQGRAALEALKDLPKDPDGMAIFAAIPGLAEQYEAGTNQFVVLVQGGGTRDALRTAERASADLRLRLMQRTQLYAELQARKRQRALADIQEVQATSSRVLLLAAILMLGIGVTTAASTAQAVRRPALRLLKATRAIQAGDYRYAVALHPAPADGSPEERPRNELMELRQAISQMAAALQAREERLEADARVSAALAGTIEVEELAAEALSEIARHAHCELGAVYALEPEGNTLRRVAGYALDGVPASFQVGEGVPGEAAARGETILVRDIPGDAPFRLRLGIDEVPPRTILAAPLCFQGSVRGVMLLGSIRDVPEETVRFVEQSARGLTVSLQNALAHQEVTRMAAELQDKNEELEAQNEELQAQSEELQAQAEEIQAQNDELQALNEEIYAQNEELQRVAGQLAEVDRHKEQFLAMLGHELRNPMAAIHSAAAVLDSSRQGSPTWSRSLEVMRRQLRHAGRLIDDLLDVSRINRGKIELQPETVDLARLVREAAEDCRSSTRGAGLEFSLETPAEPVWVFCDPTRIAQVVTNLVTNAVKYNRDGGRVAVRLTVDAAASSATVRVVDTGVGIAPEMLPQVWNPFVQEDRSLDRSRGGLGLGLALVKSLVEMHEGTVAVHSDGLGRGTEFSFQLPLAAPPPFAGGADAETETSAGPRRVLVIEDNRDAAETIQDLLELAGHTVEIAVSGAAGIRAARELRPDVVLCDIGLPGVDGYVVARELRDDPALDGTVLIALTGYGGAEDRQRAREAGFDLHLVKPVEPERLQELLQSRLRRR